MLDRDNVENILEQFAKNVIIEARKNLTRKGINASKSLYRSLDYDLDTFENSFYLALLAEEHWKYIDKGVKGAESSLKAPNSPFSYKNKKPPVNVLRTWLKRKRGVFRKRGDLSSAFAIQNAVFRSGIKATNFITRPFELAYAKLPEELIEAYGLDVEQFMEYTLNDGNI